MKANIVVVDINVLLHIFFGTLIKPKHKSLHKSKHFKNKINAMAGNQTRINSLEGSYADHYTTNACAEKSINYDIYLLWHKKFTKSNQKFIEN